jgi:hypothetical protein
MVRLSGVKDEREFLSRCLDRPLELLNIDEPWQLYLTLKLELGLDTREAIDTLQSPGEERSKTRDRLRASLSQHIQLWVDALRGRSDEEIVAIVYGALDPEVHRRVVEAIKQAREEIK